MIQGCHPLGSPLAAKEAEKEVTFSLGACMVSFAGADAHPDRTAVVITVEIVHVHKFKNLIMLRLLLN
jgi:hypothetical protein